MNPNLPAPVKGRRIWRWIIGSLAVSVSLLAIGVYHLFTLASEATALRRDVLAAIDIGAKTKVQATIGPLFLGGVRTVLRFIPNVPAEARAALAAIDVASVGVYELAASPTARARAAMFAASDAAMVARGWNRMAFINHGRRTVVIYAPADDNGGRQLRLCLAVCDHKSLVIVSTRANAEALGELVQRRGPGGQKRSWAITGRGMDIFHSQHWLDSRCPAIYRQ